MKSYIIGYDLNQPGQNYLDLFNAIKNIGAWWHYLDSTWVVTTTWSAVQIRDFLEPHLDGNDELLVAALSGEAAWVGFNLEGANWLSSNIHTSN